ncbi:SURF1 family protein [Yoonia sp. 208BN28-4]|uniref:SURF1 family protein n=1 Tax=Yoonia sp. 208BN28-4 TaxID=3126505 RepID=UPI00309D828E
MRTIIFPILLGIAGCAVLVSLGIWQVQRLAWKTEILNEIDATITAPPVALPANPTEADDKYRPVTVSGELVGDPVFVLVTPDGLGPGYRYIQALETDSATILVDMGWVPLDQLGRQPMHVRYLDITGNLHWPDDKDDWTPEPDPSGIWFARDVPDMSVALKTDPIMVIARTYDVTRLVSPLQSMPFVPLPLDTSVVKNDHLNYAITWFSLALVWAMMSLFLITRIRAKDA